MVNKCLAAYCMYVCCISANHLLVEPRQGRKVAVYKTFIVFVFEIPTLSVDVVLKDEKSATEMFVFCFEKKNMTQF